MKKFLPLFILASLLSLLVQAQCPDDVAINNITLPTCGSSNGKFTIMVTPAQTPALYESSIDGGVTWFQHTSGNASKSYTSKPAGLYNIQVRKIGTTTLCNSKQFVLRAEYNASFTATPTSATGCNVYDGKIVLSGIAQTDSVSWLSSIKPAYTVVSSLSASTINGLKPGMYYVIIKSPANNYCFSTKTVTVGNSGTTCPAPTLCSNAQGSNKFPNGTFGSGASLNGAALPNGETTYGYSQLASGSPDDGFYAIANTTDYNGSTAGGNVFNTWTLTTDHTGDANGYMMIVNASYDQDVVTEKIVSGLCPNKTYQFSAFVKNIMPNRSTSTSYITPNLTFLIDGVGVYTTGNIVDSNWNNVGFTFKSTGTSAKFSIRNNNPGGSGNDWAIDDIYVGVCVPTIQMNPFITTCVNPATQITATITDISHLYAKYKWQVNRNDGNGYVDATAITDATFDANNQYTAVVVPNPSPITDYQNGWTYRITVGESESDFSDTICSYVNYKTLIIAQCGVILPVQLQSVDAVLQNSNGKISWKVSQQLNIHHYEVEKSIDGKNFSLLSSQAPSGDQAASYIAWDKNVNQGVNYYRVKIVYADGKVAYSQIVTIVSKENTPYAKLFPNPVSDRLFVWVPDNASLIRIEVFDAVGKKVLEKTRTTVSGNVMDIEVASLSKGIYHVRARAQSGEYINLRFVKN